MTHQHKSEFVHLAISGTNRQQVELCRDLIRSVLGDHWRYRSIYRAHHGEWRCHVSVRLAEITHPAITAHLDALDTE